MGSGSSLINESNTKTKYNVKECTQRQNTVKKNRRDDELGPVIQRPGWKIVRIFVSSTFKDFFQEREILVKKVFPRIRAWCEPKKLYLVECDLRWGIPKDVDCGDTLKICLSEIDRCREENVMPFFINMVSERIGWIPESEEVPSWIKEKYKWIQGLSVTEMEIMHGAYRMDNPNALFMVREKSFLNQLPDEYKKAFVDEQIVAPEKLKALKHQIQQLFPPERFVSYHMKYDGIDSDSKKLKFIDEEEHFSETVYNFFVQRISHQYPLVKTSQDPYERTKEQHEAFMKSRCGLVFGRDDVLKQINTYVCTPANDVPLLLLGEAGLGKSSVMCRAANETVEKSLTGQISEWCKGRCRVFYHFVGAVPGSTELFPMLKRLLLEMEIVNQANLPDNLDIAVQITRGALSNVNTQPSIIFVDALNQFDDEQASSLVNWMPRKLAPNVRCVFAMINDTPQHKALTRTLNLEPTPKKCSLQPLTRDTREKIVKQLLMEYGKKLHKNQMESLLKKKLSKNPLWLSIAVEELRVHGNFRKVSEKIEQLADELLQLEIQVLERFEKESGGELLVATLSLLEVSARGLLETELLEILADCDHLMPREKKFARMPVEGNGEQQSLDRLPAAKWAVVYGALRPFLRPFGESGEGRLDFYHQSLSEAVKQRFFKDERIYQWWHAKLADYFEKTGTNIQNMRKIEEYPVHLIAIDDRQRLETFLVEWPVFDQLFDEEYSYKLLQLWREGSDLQRLRDCYLASIDSLANSSGTTKDELSRKQEKVAQLLVQSGHHDKAEELALKAMKLETEELGSRPERMAALHFLLAYVRDEKFMLVQDAYTSQLPTMQENICEYEAAVKLLRQLPGEKNKAKMARALNRLSYYYSGYHRRGGDNYLSKDEAKEKAMTTIESAIELFKEAFEEALDIILQVVDENHPFAERVLLNTGNHYDRKGCDELAYVAYKKWHRVCSNLYGDDHPRTRRTIDLLHREKFLKIAEKDTTSP